MDLARAVGTVVLVGAVGGAAYLAARRGSLPLSLPVSIPGLTPPAATPAAAAPGRPTSGPRGIRNNNPGNITAGVLPWRGQAGADGRYVVFDAPLYGLRAIYRLLGNYHLLYGINTIAKISARWAPAPENNPAAYATNVANAAGIPTLQPLDFGNFDTMTRVAKGIIVAENGPSYAGYYPADLFAQAWAIRG